MDEEDIVGDSLSISAIFDRNVTTPEKAHDFICNLGDTNLYYPLDERSTQDPETLSDEEFEASEHASIYTTNHFVRWSEIFS